MRGRKRLISKKEMRLFWLVALSLSVLAGGGTALYLTLNKPEEPKNLLPDQSPFKSDVDDTIPDSLSLQDFLLPAPGGQWLSRTWDYSRQGLQKWSAEEITPFWSPVEDLEALRLPENNEALFDRYFEDVP